MEFLIELLLQSFGELLLQLFVEILLEAGLHSVAEPFRSRPNPWFAAARSVCWSSRRCSCPRPSGVWPAILTPIAAGLTVTLVGTWHLRRNQSLVRPDRFAYGYLFALAMALVRHFYGH